MTEFTIKSYDWENFKEWLVWRHPDIEPPDEGCVGALFGNPKKVLNNSTERGSME
jgi:hypothetical protein